MYIEMNHALMSCKEYALLKVCGQPHISRLVQDNVIDYTRLGGHLLIVMTPTSRDYTMTNVGRPRNETSARAFIPRVEPPGPHSESQKRTLHDLKLDYLIRTG